MTAEKNVCSKKAAQVWSTQSNGETKHGQEIVNTCQRNFCHTPALAQSKAKMPTKIQMKESLLIFTKNRNLAPRFYALHSSQTLEC